MTRREAIERTQFEDAICAESSLPWSDARHRARLLCRHGKTYARLQEDNCNGVGTFYNEDPKRFARRQEAFEKRLEHRENLLETRIRVIVSELGDGFGVIFNGDPRGATIKVTVPSGRTNDWGHEGLCVPTA